MEGTIHLGEVEWRIKANALTPFHYKNQFNSDILKDTLRAIGDIEGIMQLSEAKDANDYKKLQTLIDHFDTMTIYQLLWSFVKTADKNVKPFYDWLEEIDYMPVTDLLLNDDFTRLLVGNIHRKK